VNDGSSRIHTRHARGKYYDMRRSQARAHEEKQLFSMSPPGHAIELRVKLFESVKGAHFTEDVRLRFGSRARQFRFPISPSSSSFAIPCLVVMEKRACTSHTHNEAGSARVSSTEETASGGLLSRSPDCVDLDCVTGSSVSPCSPGGPCRPSRLNPNTQQPKHASRCFQPLSRKHTHGTRTHESSKKMH